MGDTSLTKLSGIFSLLSAACIIGAIAIGIASGGQGPQAMDFGDPALLARLHADKNAILLVSLALIGPALGLGAGLGWYALLRGQRAYALLGILLWYLGMIFIVWQDALELVLVTHLPARYAAADATGQAALLAAGGLLGDAIALFTLLGDLISFFGLLLVGVALWEKAGRWRWLGAVGILSAVAISLGLVVPALAPLRLLGFILFMVWMIAMGIAMLRWRPDAAG